MLAVDKILITKVLAANKISGIMSGDESIEKSVGPKIGKLKSLKLSKLR